MTSPPRDGRADPLVLIVEDEFLIALDLQLQAEENGWRVLGPVGSVEEALALLAETRPDVALLDGNLRGRLSGPVADALRALGVPFIVVSAYDSARLAGTPLAGVPRLAKPASAAELRRAVGAIAPR